jgi:hypothetical protein
VAATYVHSIYLDLMLLGRMQLEALNHLANQITIRSEPMNPLVLAELEHTFLQIRRSLWVRHATLRRIGAELLGRYQRQHRMEELLTGIDADLSNASRYVDATTNRGINAALGLVTVVGLPFGLAYAGGAVWADPSPGLFWACTAIAAVTALVLGFVLRPVQHMISNLRHRLPR